MKPTIIIYIIDPAINRFNPRSPVQDMADSRRINSNIREEESRLSEEEQPPLALSAIILSSEFWPTLKEEKLELPPLVCQAMEAYTHRYEKLKVEFVPSSIRGGVVFYTGPHCWCIQGHYDS